MEDRFILKDSGERQSFETGAVRDTQSGKGRFDLLSPIVDKRLAIIMEKGALKYNPRNWEKGIPLSRFLDSAKRHLAQFIEGHVDEDHLGQAIWNLNGLMHTQELIKRGLLPSSLDDLPNYLNNITFEIKDKLDSVNDYKNYLLMLSENNRVFRRRNAEPMNVKVEESGATWSVILVGVSNE